MARGLLQHVVAFVIVIHSTALIKDPSLVDLIEVRGDKKGPEGRTGAPGVGRPVVRPGAGRHKRSAPSSAHRAPAAGWAAAGPPGRLARPAALCAAPACMRTPCAHVPAHVQ